MKKCKLIPLSHRLIIEEAPAIEMTSGGIAVPRDVVEKTQAMSTEGVIIAMAVDAFDFLPEETRPKIGDVIYFQKYDGIGKKYADKSYRILVDDKVFAISSNYISAKEDITYDE